MKNGSILQTHQLEKVYTLGRKVKVPALRGVSFTLRRGEILAILGPSGSGKSTLLNLLGALDKATGGEIHIDGQDLARLTNGDLALFRRKIGFVFQNFNLIHRLTALDNVVLPLKIAGVRRKERLARARELLTAVGLGDRMDHRPTELSGGQQQRVAIARALALDPSFLLMDEPTGNVDTKTRDEILDVIRQINKKRGTTVIIITHDPAVAAVAGRVLQLVDGVIQEEGEVLA